jgi:hypothetical protein
MTRLRKLRWAVLVARTKEITIAYSILSENPVWKTYAKRESFFKTDL